MRRLAFSFCAAALCLFLLPACAADSNYNPLQTFVPFDNRFPVNRYRAGDGTPGPDYWQNRADYEIHATIDPGHKTLVGYEVITYTNNSPQALDYLWLQLDQNRYRADARGNFGGGGFPGVGEHTEGYRIASVEVADGGGFAPVHYLVSDTRMRIDLPRPLAANGHNLRIRIHYGFTIPASGFGGRTGWGKTENGVVYNIAQWYPRMCVFDDLHGWNALPYLNNEFYLEYGDFDYYVTVPWNMLVIGSGKLMNPEDVLTATQRERLEKAHHSEKTVIIRSADEVHEAASRPVRHGTLTWHYRMNNTRDVAFGASAAFIWDAAHVDLPGGHGALAMSAYTIESLEQGGWERSTQYLRFIIGFFSDYVYLYPYPTVVSIGGTVGGMEYPGLAFDWYKANEPLLFWLTLHEVGHTWFPMIVGSNERRYAWMDEGMNTFVDVLATAAFNNGEFAPKSDSEYAPKTGDPIKDILPVLSDPAAPPILTRADVIPEQYRHPVTYFKTALGLVLLREQILGPERFDSAFRHYVHAWAFKHPSPSDFFRAMESVSGEELDWFWNGWFAHNWALDLAVRGVKYVDGDPAKGALVTVANLDKMVMPATLQVTWADGSKKRVRIPVATWMRHDHYDVLIPGSGRVASATIDPDHVLPDRNRANNSFKPKR
ncbi:MAG: M1 family metallopeptidase [Gammaproteobacteria bacterium]|nr:M1 family metallopeptidase [Gammaproteobacteria bacterium]